MLIIVILGVLLTFNVSGFKNYVAPYANSGQKGWWNRNGWARFGYPAYSYWETFQNPATTGKPGAIGGPAIITPNKIKTPADKILSYPPDTPSPANLSLREPYHLLGDELQAPSGKEAISRINSRSCYATDFVKDIEKVSNYRQFTNNYKHNYPDSCSAPTQELVLNFYETK